MPVNPASPLAWRYAIIQRTVKMLCEKCHWFENKNPSKNCEFCNRTGLPEDVLCYLVRNSSEREDVSECHSYRSKLSLVSPEQEEQTTGDPEEADQYLSTDKEKYLMALSQQNLIQSPDKVHFKLQYHLCLVTKNREKLFLDTSEFLEDFINLFKEMETLFSNTEIEMLHLPSDHVHLYINTTPDYAFDEIANKIKTLSDECIAIIFKNVINEGKNIWETGYFSETIG